MNSGDPVIVTWLDISSDAVGDPKKARLFTRRTVGIFERYCIQKYDKKRVKVLICKTTMDEDDDSQSGYDVYPVSVVLKVQELQTKEDDDV